MTLGLNEHNIKTVGVDFSKSMVNIKPLKRSQMSYSGVCHVRPVVKAGREGMGERNIVMSVSEPYWRQWSHPRPLKGCF